MGPNPTWDVQKFPDVALDPQGHPLAAEPGGSGDYLQWHPAPATSHVHSFALVAGTGRRRDVVTAASWVHVRFRDRTGKITAHYGYQFDTADNARAAFADLAAAEHPGKHPMVVRPNSRSETKGLIGYTRH